MPPSQSAGKTTPEPVSKLEQHLTSCHIVSVGNEVWMKQYTAFDPLATAVFPHSPISSQTCLCYGSICKVYISSMVHAWFKLCKVSQSHLSLCFHKEEHLTARHAQQQCIAGWTAINSKTSENCLWCMPTSEVCYWLELESITWTCMKVLLNCL